MIVGVLRGWRSERDVTNVTYTEFSVKRTLEALKFQASNEFSRRFASALKARREAAGLSHNMLAQRSGMSRAAISMIESGQRSPSLISCHAICAALGTTVGQISAQAEE